MGFLKSLAWVWFIVLRIIAATLFVTSEQNAIFMLHQLNIWEFRL